MTTKAISVSEFKTHCLKVIRQVKRDGTVVDLLHRGRHATRAFSHQSVLGADAGPKGQLRMDEQSTHWLPTAAAPEIGTVLSLDIATVLALDALPAGFQGDPADRIIVERGCTICRWRRRTATSAAPGW